MNLAVRYEWIERNPAARATMPSVRKRKPNASGPQLAARLLSHVWEQGDGLRRTAAGTGTLHRCGSWYSGS